MMRKIKTLVAMIVLALGSLTGLLLPIPLAHAATQPPGTCFVMVQGQAPTTEPCTKVFKTDPATKKLINPGNKKLLDPKGCYEYTAGMTDNIVTQVACDDTPLNGKKEAQQCVVDGKNVDCQYCDAAQTQLAPNNDPSQCNNGPGCASKGLASVSSSSGADSNACIVAGTGDPALQGCGTAAQSNSTDTCGIINKYVNPAIQLLSAIAGIAVAIAIVYGGILYSASGGDQAKVTKAKSLIRNAVLALIGFAFLWAFLQFLVPGGLFKK